MPYWRLYYHLTWATKARQPMLTKGVEQRIYRLIATKAEDLGSRVYAVNGVLDHVHVVASISPSMAIAAWVKHVKASSSWTINDMALEHDLYWQTGYGVVSFGERQLSTVIAYVKNQKEHHRDKTLYAALEHQGRLNHGPDCPAFEG